MRRMMTAIVAFVALISISFLISLSSASVAISNSLSQHGQENKTGDLIGNYTFFGMTSRDQQLSRQCSIVTCNRRHPNCCPGYRCSIQIFVLGGLGFCHYIVPPRPKPTPPPEAPAPAPAPKPAPVPAPDPAPAPAPAPVPAPAPAPKPAPVLAPPH